MYHIYVLLFAGSFLPILPVDATESENIRFTSLSILDGLSQSSVFSVKQDKKGFLWIATADGLNRYDGYTFSVYRHNKNDANSIQSNRIRYVHIDRDDHLWLGTATGLSYYDRENDRFVNYPLDTQVNCVCRHDDDVLFVATNRGVMQFDKRTKVFCRVPVGEKDALQAQIIVHYNSLLLVGCSNGLFMSPPDDKHFVPFRNELLGKNIIDLLPSAQGLWIATEGDGLFRYSVVSGKLTQYRHDERNDRSISSDFVRSLCMDMQDRLWVGTFNGLNIFNESTASFDRYLCNEIEKGSISQNSVRSLLLDNQGAMWVGTYYGGLNYYHPFRNRFGRLSHIPYTNSLSDNVVSCITEGRRNELWIGTNDNGINVYDIDRRRFTYHTATDARPFILSNNVKAILADENDVYAGTHGGGFSHLHRRTGKTTVYTSANSRLPCNNVYALCKTPDGNILTGTLEGLTIFDTATRTFRPFVEDASGHRLAAQSIFALFIDSRQRLWIGTDNGVFVCSFPNRTLEHYPAGHQTGALSDAHVNCISEDNKKRIWIGTANGLNRFNEADRTFTALYTENGLPNNIVFGILHDCFGRLWISTNRGLACFISETEKFRTYHLIDGIQSDQFNNYAYCKTAAGEMYFGGINGITHFFPEQLVDNPFVPRTVISQLNLFNRKVSPGDETRLLKKDICETEQLVFRPEQTSFSLTFTVANYLSAKHNTFAYRLAPFEDWNYTTDTRTVSYSNLPHGNYVFSVKSANSDGKWNTIPTTLNIRILPHWYQHPAVRCLFALFALAIALFIIRFSRHRRMLKNQLVMERIEKEKTEEVNQMKLRFFINISHEFRTPLTLIVSPLQELIERTTDKWTRDRLKLVFRNTNKLLHLVNQLMDYRRAELGVFELHVVEQDPVPQIEESMQMFEQLAGRKKIDFILENDLHDAKVLHDPYYLSLILNNLLSNAFKFTPEGGKISIGLSVRQAHFVLQVHDTGCGIAEEHQQRIFDRYYQISAENTGTGIGLSLVKRLVDLHHGKLHLQSAPGQGAAFDIHLPQDRNVYSEPELSIQNQPPPAHNRISEDIIDLLRLPEEKRENPGVDNSKPQLLIVEDDPEARDYLAESFREIANVECAANGEDALQIVKNVDIDLIISDLMLPVMDGLKLCRTVKQNIRTCHIPIILLTAKAAQYDQLEGLSAGADDYVAKPFNLSILKTKVQNMLKAKRRTLEHYSNTLEIDPERITFNAMDKQLLEKAKDIVNKHLADADFSIDDFCREMAMSRSSLHLKLKAVTGESTIDFIRKIRFSHACRLLKDGRYSVAEISAIVGFNTPSYFTTSFKKYFGMQPTEYVRGTRE
jgi:signal transduction histidine kinase/ligand-binding sensor domain-containing protein/DNA-binding response OmpR family regulator